MATFLAQIVQRVDTVNQGQWPLLPAPLVTTVYERLLPTSLVQRARTRLALARRSATCVGPVRINRPLAERPFPTARCAHLERIVPHLERLGAQTALSPAFPGPTRPPAAGFPTTGAARRAGRAAIVVEELASKSAFQVCKVFCMPSQRCPSSKAHLSTK